MRMIIHFCQKGITKWKNVVLNKEGKLTDEEFTYIRKHPQIGADILNKSHRLREISDIVLMHHERYDGKGYPTGAKGVKSR